MTLRQFIREHRTELDAQINNAIGFVPRQASCNCPKSGTDHYHAPAKLDDDEREGWVLNEESLYRWAKSEGVRI